MGFRLWEDLLLGRVVPSASSTVTAFVAIAFLMWLFRVRNPGTRYLLYQLPLIKGLVVLVRGVPAPLPGFENKFRFGFQMLDPLSLLKMPDLAIRTLDVGFQQIDMQPQWDSALAQAAFFMAVGMALGVLGYRWLGLSLYYRRLLSMPAATPLDAPAVFRVLDRLVPAFGIAYPRVVLVDEMSMAPCTVGLRPPTMVLPSKLLHELDDEQLEAVLAHELAHVSRKDGVLHWPSLLLRDLQVFNPLVHWLFVRVLVEREMDADLRAAGATGRPRAMAKALVEVALLAKGVNLRPAPGAMSFGGTMMGSTAIVERRVRALLGCPRAVSRLRPLGILLLLLYLLFVRIFVHFPAFGHVVMLE